MKKILALLLALVMVLALAACGGGSAPAADEPTVEAPEAPTAPEAPAAEAGDDFAEYKVYFGEYAAAGAPNDEERENMKNLIDGCATFADIEALQQSTVLFDTVGVLRFDEWVAAGKPAADTSDMGSPSDEPSGEMGDATGEMAEPAEETNDEASGEPSGDPPPQEIYFDGAVEGIQGELPTELVMNVELTLADGYSLTVEGGEATNEGNVWTVAGTPGPDPVYVTVIAG